MLFSVLQLLVSKQDLSHGAINILRNIKPYFNYSTLSTRGNIYEHLANTHSPRYYLPVYSCELRRPTSKSESVTNVLGI